jgi:hypothetical protein
MPYTLKISSDHRVAIVRRTGVVTVDELETAACELEEHLAGAPLPFLLVDLSQIEQGPSKADYLLWVRNRSKPPFVAERMAIIGNDDFADEIEFAVLAARNRGFNVAVFPDERSALNWLAGAEQAQ